MHVGRGNGEDGETEGVGRVEKVKPQYRSQLPRIHSAEVSPLQWVKHVNGVVGTRTFQRVFEVQSSV